MGVARNVNRRYLPRASPVLAVGGPGRPVRPFCFSSLLSLLLALGSTSFSGCFYSEVLGDDVERFAGQVDDTAVVRFHTADDLWVSLIVMSETGGRLFCTDFENADWIQLIQGTDTILLQLYEEDGNQWVSEFGDLYDRGDAHFASGAIWTQKLVGEDGRDIPFSREEALDPCLGHLLEGDNAERVQAYDHDFTASITWWSEGIDLRGNFTGSAAAGYIRAVDCGPLEVEWEIRDKLRAYAEGC